MTSRPILVVEDDEGIRESIKEILALEGYRVITANDGCEALEVLRREALHPDALPCWILLDIFMPRLSGTECLTEIRKDRQFDKIPVTLLSAGANLQQEAKRFGVDFVAKPVSIDALLRMAAEHSC